MDRWMPTLYASCGLIKLIMFHDSHLDVLEQGLDYMNIKADTSGCSVRGSSRFSPLSATFSPLPSVHIVLGGLTICTYTYQFSLPPYEL
jgi:hypothetical protein